jgi:putrescine transport system ATP-binding protein
MTDGSSSSRARGRTGFAPWADPTARPLVRFEAVSKRFGDVSAVDRLTLDIYEGEFFALLGPSGCGKTTLLRMLAGFEQPDEGRILLDGADIAGVPPHRRPVNMMFQSYALFPHLTVAGNVAFGLKQEKLTQADIDQRVRDILKLVQLEGLELRKPHSLSGGQRQRVALARALVKRPRVLLLDEPLSALDRKLREDTRFELMDLQERLGLTFVMVTHDQDEAMTTSDRIGVMNHGRLVQVAPPEEVYEQPNSRWIADFVGDVNLLEGQLADTGPSGSTIECAGIGTLRVAQPIDAPAGTMLWVALRPEKIQVGTTPAALGSNGASGTVVDVGYLGDLSVYKVRLDGGAVLKASAPNQIRRTAPQIARGDPVFLSWPDNAGVVLTQ